MTTLVSVAFRGRHFICNHHYFTTPGWPQKSFLCITNVSFMIVLKHNKSFFRALEWPVAVYSATSKSVLFLRVVEDVYNFDF